MRALAYCRQSDSRGAGADSLSIESMVAELTRWCEAEGWELVKVIREPDAKGWQDETQRPGIAEALDLARDRAYDVLCVWDMSRFARSVRIQEDLIFRFAALGVDVRSKTEPHVNQSPMIRQIISAVNEEATRTISKHVKRAVVQRIRQGKWHGQAPYGHRKGADGRLVPDEAEAPVAAEIVQRRANGESFIAIGDDLNDRGIGRRGAFWNHRSVRDTAMCPAHVGIVVAGAERFEGAHPAIVDRTLWEAALARFSEGRRAGRRGAARSFLSGRAYCGCGQPLYAVMHTTNRRDKGRIYKYIRLRCKSFNADAVGCGAPKRAIAMAKAHRFAEAQLASDLEAARSWRDALAWAKAEQQRVAPALIKERTRLLAARTKIEARRARLIDARAEGIITQADLAVRLAPIDAELTEVTAKIADAPTAPDPETFREAGAVIATMRAAIRSVPAADLAALMAAVRASFHLEDGRMRLRYRAPFDLMLGGD